MENILEVKGLNKSYQHFSLQDVSFSLPEGCITGFIGINGAGKTSTLKSILGLTPKISGDIRLFGLNMDTNEKEICCCVGGCYVFDCCRNGNSICDG